MPRRERDGALEFARFAYPPNELGLCGPGDPAELIELAAHEAGLGSGSGPGTPAAPAARLRQLAGGFEGAWPYLQLIAAANGVPDPLDGRVVRAYWIGNDLLDAVGPALLGDQLDERFRRRAGQFAPLTAALEHGARPHHNFHVFCVYPWVGLLRYGSREHALRVVDRCRIRWGRVEAVSGGVAVVRTQQLTWDGHTLGLAPPAPESVTWQQRGYRMIGEPQPGDAVALHWDWLARPLTRRQTRQLQAETRRHLAIANHTLAGSPLAG